MKIILAKTAGFCFGVNRAVNIVYELLNEGKSVCTLGPIIHNKEMVSELENKGVFAVGSADDVKNGATLVIRSHGVKQSVIDRLTELHVNYVDATCPFVSKIHKLVSAAGRENKTVFIAGDENHPEVQGIIGHCCGDYYTFKSGEELSELLDKIPLENKNGAVIVAQTTFDTKEWKKSIKIFKKVYTNAEIFDTICNATSQRQEEADEISKISDAVVVIGDKTSSNTCKLYNICKKNCDKTYLIETAKDMNLSELKNFDVVGVTAGASAPARIIKEVLDTMSEEIRSGEVIDKEENFEEMLEESLKSLNTNERVTGTVVGIAPNEVYVDVGRKQAGFIPADELSSLPFDKIEDVVKVGDKLELLIMKTNDQEGTIMLSKRRVDAKKGWEVLEKACEDKEVLTGVVTKVVNGGVIVVCNNVEVFIPASQATLSREDSLDELLNKEVQFRLIEVSKRGRRSKVVGSIRSVLKDLRAEQKAAFWETAEVGKKYTGVVKSLTSYGAFVDLGGVFGMIHISELSWLRIKHPSEVVNVGDTVECYIKDINTETNKISLGFKKVEDNPWEIFKNNYPVGTVVKAKIVGLTSFGAFANIIPGIDGLIHISQIANKRVEKPQDELKVGEEVEAKITAVDFEKKRVSLSIKALLPDAPVIDDTELQAPEKTQETPAAEETVAETEATPQTEE